MKILTYTVVTVAIIEQKSKGMDTFFIHHQPTPFRVAIISYFGKKEVYTRQG